MEKILYCRDKSSRGNVKLPFSLDKTSKLQDISCKTHDLVIIQAQFLRKRRQLKPSHFSDKICLLHCPVESRDNLKLVKRFGLFGYFTDQDSRADISFKLSQARQLVSSKKQIARLEAVVLEKDKKIEDVILVDPLTGCYNWRYFWICYWWLRSTGQEHEYCS